ncbi:flippase-like domain-containing protein [archaeon]|nr:flippase-like domain-containing protein [archaeon]
MKKDKLVSIALLLIAGIIAGPQNLLNELSLANYSLLAMGLFAGLLVSVLEAFKNVFIIRESVESSIESMQAMPQISITSQGNEQLIQTASSFVEGIKKGFVKASGKAMLVFYKVLDFGVKAIAAFCGLIYLIFPFVELLGLWIILSTVYLLVVFKFSDVVGRIFPFAGSGTDRSKKTLIGYGLMSLSAWVLSSVALWAFFRAFGVQFDVVAFFFLTALFATLSLAPFTFDGIGLIELVGMGTFGVLGAPLAVGFLALVLWEGSKLLGDLIVSFLPERRNVKDLEKYR